MASISYTFVLFCCWITIIAITHSIQCHGKESIRGHLQPLGMHRDPEGHVDTYEADQLPTAAEFFNKYVKPKRPVLFRNAAKVSPAFKKWSDDYLLNNYGDLQVKLESKLEKKVVPIGDVGLGRDSIRHFLNTYTQRDVYVVSQLPDPMAKDLKVPPCLTCGSFHNRIMEANLWVSNGGTSSLLHKDALNTLNCLINGTKDWIMISDKHIKNIPMAQEPESEIGGFSMLNVDKVNMERYPNFAKVPWHYANVSRGDCLYIPTGYLHQVRSTGPQNLAYSFLLDYNLIHLKRFDNNGCSNNRDYEVLDPSKIVWNYPGFGSMTMGNPSPWGIRDGFVAAFRGNKKVKAKNFMKYIRKHGLVMEDNPGRAKIQMKAYEQFFDIDNKEYITSKDVLDLSFKDWTSITSLLDPDSANREDFEYYNIDRKLMKRVVKKSVDKATGNLDKDLFMKNYQLIRGSVPFAKKNMAILDSNGDGVIEKDEIKQNLEKLLKLFDTESVDDMVVVTDTDYLQGRGNSEPSPFMRGDDEDDEEGDEAEGLGQFEDENEEGPTMGDEDERNYEGDQDSQRDRDEL